MSSGAIDPINNPEAWDSVLVGQQKSPGICKLGEFKQQHEWDVKKGKGVYGATITYVGLPPATGSITFYLWLPIHFQQWDTFRAAFKYDATKKTPQAIDIYHPSLADLDMSSFVCEGIGAITHEGQGLYSITVDLLEYRPPPKASAVGTPSGSQANKANSTPGNSPNDPVADAQQKEIAALLAQASQP